MSITTKLTLIKIRRVALPPRTKVTGLLRSRRFLGESARSNLS